jgi:uncharacterized protein YbaA (DUF1428 family)
VDGFVVPVPKRKLAAYRAMSRRAGKVWREHGALEFVECIADDVKPGKSTSFPQSVKLKAGETVFFSYIVYKSRADRDRVEQEGDVGSAPPDMMDPEEHALRRQAHVLRRLQGGGLVLRRRAAQLQRVGAVRYPYPGASCAFLLTGRENARPFRGSHVFKPRPLPWRKP